MEVVNRIKTEIEGFNAKRKQLVEELQKEFPMLLKPLFDKYSPDIQSIGWSQYTPYFNDGDECVFSVQNDDLNMNGEYAYDLELTKEQSAALEEFSQILQSVPEDFYKDLFGDHVQVTVHADGKIDVEEYEHD